MSSARRRDGNVRETFESKTSYFYKIISSETIRDRKLGIPRRFVRKYGEDLTQSVYLNVSTGAIWKVELKSCECEGKIWFQKGWNKFVEYYSIKETYLLVFRYEGNSKFHVLIFDSALEIDYPLFNTTHDEEPNIKKSDSEEEVLKCKKKRKKFSLSCFVPKKRMRTNSTIKTEKASKLDKSERKRYSHSTQPVYDEVGGCSKSASKTKTQKWMQSEVPQRKLPVSADAKARALERARAFKSDRPFYVVSVHTSHVHPRYLATVPSTFTGTFLSAERGNVILRDSEGKSWSVKYHIYTLKNMPRVRRVEIYWKEFSQDNCLEVGDACVFELIKSSETISFKITIFRAADQPYFGNQRKAITGESKRSLVTKKKSGLSAPTEKVFKLPKGLSYSKAHSLEATRGFKSKYPFFEVVMHPGYLLHGHLNVPRSFADRYINKSTFSVTLQVADRFWEVKVIRKENTTTLSAGWPAFVRENALQSGDVCLFELIERNRDILNVTIIRRLT